MSRVEAIGECFADYRVVCFENNSRNDTRSRLAQWTRDNPKCHLMACEENARCKLPNAIDPRTKSRRGYMNQSARMVRMATLRERMWRYVQQHYADFDYMLVMDMDLDIVSMRVEDIHTCFETSDWIATSAYSVFPRTPYMIYDVFAAWSPSRLGPMNNDSPRFRTDRQIQLEVHRHAQNAIERGDTRVAMRCTFNGMCFYDLPELLRCGASYLDPIRQAEGECEHVTFARSWLGKTSKGCYMNLRWRVFVRHF